MRKIGQISLIALIYLFFSISKPVFADSPKFSSAYDVTYTVKDNGSTTITQNIHLTNLTTEAYASQFLLKLQGESISNLRAFDRRGEVKFTQKRTGDTDEINFKFNDEVVGLGKTLNWTLTYDTPSIVHKVGQLWELYIPPPEIPQNTTSYTIGLYTPVSFGPPIYQKPLPNAGAAVWSLTNFSKTGIFAAFAPKSDFQNPHQVYDFSLKYHLQNSALIGITKTIALPPDTSYQKIAIKFLTPQPDQVEVDADGNWIASYPMDPGSALDVTATGSAQVFIRPQMQDQSNLSLYLEPTKFWPSDNPKIKSIASQLGTAEKIYNFVSQKLHYDRSRITGKKGRVGALDVLKNPQSAICIEFTDLFVALARSAGIPTREVDGFGYTLNQQRQPISTGRDVLHAWPEYFDPHQHVWKMVDPTWGNTTGGIDYFNTFDLDHLTFAIHGKSDSLPAPAGAYKITNSITPSKDIQVVPSPNDFPKASSVLNFSLKDADNILAPLPTSGKIVITNDGPSASKPTLLQLNSVLKLQPSSWTLPVIPPFGAVELPVTITAPSLTDQGNVTIAINYDHGQAVLSTHAQPIYESPIFLLIAVVALIVIFSTAVTVIKK